ncbi:DNA end-binding protein Ku, partial [Paracoccus alcaliphilus]
KMGEFDPNDFDDRYDAALADLVRAKLEGRKITPVKAQKRGKVVDLMEALRESAGVTDKKPRKSRSESKAKPATSRKKAG